MKVELTMKEMSQLSIEELEARLSYALKNQMHYGFIIENLEYEIDNRKRMER